MDKNEKNSLENLLIKKNIRWWSNSIINTPKNNDNDNNNDNMNKSNFISKNLPFDFEKSWFENIENEIENKSENSVLPPSTSDGGLEGVSVSESHKNTEIEKPYLSIISPEPRYVIIKFVVTIF
jgi:hypothetical protein